ncbi:MAG: glycosyltransferase family A protein [Anaerolineae bacterium]
MTSPLFSILIPTRNRGHLISDAIRSALAQTYGDYELVIVANNCADNTREVVQSFSDPRIRYVETDRTLTMPDNWDFAFSQARGRYVTILSDDDAIVPNTLRYVAEQAINDNPRVVTWEDANYFYPDWRDPAMRNITLLFRYSDNAIEDLPSRTYIEMCRTFSFSWSTPIPKGLNCVVDREFFEDWRGKLGKLFYAIAPDFAFAWLTTHLCPTIRVLHRPLAVRGISDNSIGSSHGMGPNAAAFYREFGELDFFKETPITIPSTVNHIAATLLRVSAALRQVGVEATQLDWQAFLLAAVRQFREAKTMIPDWESYIPELLRAADQFSSTVQQEVRQIIATPPEEPAPDRETIWQLKQRTARMALEYPPNVTLKAAKHQGDEQCARCQLGLQTGVLAAEQWGYLYMFGEELGAANIYETSLHVEEHYDLLMRCYRKQQQQQQEHIPLP